MQPAALTTCNRSFLEQRCVERGYTLDEVMPCVVSQDGDEWTVDVESPFYPKVSRLPEPPSPGPGWELKMLLAGWPFYITSTASCPCNAYARQMHEWGCDGCEERMEEIVAHLRGQATARGLPFVDAAGRFLVRRAIKNARKKQH
jgi:hypothetical protein